MKFVRGFAVVALVLPTSAISQVLWRDIELEMSADQVRTLHPAGEHVTHLPAETLLEDVQVSPECEADVHIHHESGTVDRVVLRGGGAVSGRCANRVLEVLAARYGQAAAREERRGILRRPSQDHVWSREGVMVRFRRFGGNEYGGGGLLRASWELTYSAVDTDMGI